MKCREEWRENHHSPSCHEKEATDGGKNPEGSYRHTTFNEHGSLEKQGPNNKQVSDTFIPCIREHMAEYSDGYQGNAVENEVIRCQVEVFQLPSLQQEVMNGMGTKGPRHYPASAKNDPELIKIWS